MMEYPEDKTIGGTPASEINVGEPRFGATPPENQTPPRGFEAQPDLQPGQQGGVYVRQSDLIADAESEHPDTMSEEDGDADDGDDVSEDPDEED